jgi:ribosome maturation factor RimP
LAHPLIPELEQLAQATVVSQGFILRGVNIQTHRIPMTVQVLVQRNDGKDISLDECANLSTPLAEALDAVGLLGEAAYVLEVSSPGVSEELHDDRDFRSFRGFPVSVLYRQASGKEARCDGLLLERNATDLQINIRGRCTRIPRNNVTQVRLVTPSNDN